MFALIFASCAEEDLVLLQGTVVEAQDSTAPLAEATLAFVDEQGRSLGGATTDSYGDFEIDLPAGVNVFVFIDAAGFVTSVFPGVIGLEPVQQVEGYALYGVSVEEHDALLATWAGCPGLTDTGAIVVGEQRIFGLTDTNGESPSVNTGIATLTSIDDGTILGGCYLTDDGAAYDPEAETTGASGAFMVAGPGPGPWQLEVAYEYGVDQWSTAVYPLWLRQGGPIVSPWYPAWVPFGT